MRNPIVRGLESHGLARGRTPGEGSEAVVSAGNGPRTGQMPWRAMPSRSECFRILIAWRAVAEFQTSPGMRDILPPESARYRAFVGEFAAVVEAAGYGQIIPPLLEDAGVFSRVGEATDVVTKEMYDVRRPRRPTRRPAPGADRQRVPGVRPAPADHAVEGVVRRAELPLREATARPLPAVRPGRHRGARRRRPVPRRRGHRPRLGALRPPRAAPGAPAAQLARRAGRPGPLHGRPAGPLHRARRRPVGGEPGDAGQEPVAGARLQAARRRPGDRRRAGDRRRSTPTPRPPTSPPCRTACGRSASRSTSTPSWCAGSTTTGARRSSTRA